MLHVRIRRQVSHAAFPGFAGKQRYHQITEALLYYYCCKMYGRAISVPDAALPEDAIGPEEHRDA